MRDGIGPYIAIAALLLTLGGSLYAWASTQGQMQMQVQQLRSDVDALKTQLTNLSADTNGMRLEVTRWMAATDAANRKRDAR